MLAALVLIPACVEARKTIHQWGTHTGTTSLCESARAMARKIEPAMEQLYTTKIKPVISKFGGFKFEMLTDYFQNAHGYDPSAIRYVRSRNFGTQVVDMHLTEEVRQNIIKEIRWTRKLQGLIADYLESLGQPRETGNYALYSLEFENAILFSPSSFDFYEANVDKIEEYFPDAGGVQLNAFSVAANASAYGVHNARSWAVGQPYICDRDIPPDSYDCLFADKQMSLHTALEDVSYGHQPLIVYEDADPEVPSTTYMIRRLLESETNETRAELYSTAQYLDVVQECVGHDFLTTTQYIFARYIESKYCSRPYRTPGVWWNIKAGQALFFNNYQPHGDGTLPLSDRDRFTVDLRIFSKDRFPQPGSAVSFWLKQMNRVQMVKDCIVKILGYEGHDEFVRTITGANRVTMSHLMTDIFLALHGSYNTGKRQDILTYGEGLRRHYRRVESILSAEPVLNDRAKKCIAKSVIVGLVGVTECSLVCQLENLGPDECSCGSVDSTEYDPSVFDLGD